MAVQFHLAFPVQDIPKTRMFYVEGLGCQPGRESPASLILNLEGHQIVAHVTPKNLEPQGSIYPRHFGLIFSEESQWEALLQRAKTHQLPFYQEPKIRFSGTPLEHRTFFLEDPFFNLLEFKFYRYPESVFGSTDHALVGDAPPSGHP
jgi:uncharacterized protein